MLLNGELVCWKSYKQKCTAVSSTEAEYIALSEFVRELSNLRCVAVELGMKREATIIFEDNQACTKWTKDVRKRTKHIDVRYHISREAVRNQEMELKCCPPKHMIDDALTKPFGPRKFAYLTQMMQTVNRRQNENHMATRFAEAEC